MQIGWANRFRKWSLQSFLSTSELLLMQIQEIEMQNLNSSAHCERTGCQTGRVYCDSNTSYLFESVYSNPILHTRIRSVSTCCVHVTVLATTECRRRYQQQTRQRSHENVLVFECQIGGKSFYGSPVRADAFVVCFGFCCDDKSGSCGKLARSSAGSEL